MRVPLNEYRMLLARYVRPHRGLVTGLAALFLAGIVFRISWPLLAAEFVDRATGSPEPALRTLLWIAVAFCVAGVLDQVCVVGGAYLGAHIAWLVTNQLHARDTTTAVTNLVGEVFGGVQAIKAASAEQAVLDRFRQLNDARRRAEVRSESAVIGIDALTVAVLVAGRGLILFIAAGAMLDERFSVGDFLLFITYLDWMLMLPRRVGRLLSQRRTSANALDRIAETMGDTPLRTLVRHRPVHLFGEPPELEPPPCTETDRLRELTVRGLSYTYPDATRGIHDIDLTLRRGSVTVVTGEVGAGKSTLLEVLLGLREREAGEIRWNGESVRDPAVVMVPPRVAYKPQVPRLFSESLRDTILLGVSDDRLDRAVWRAAFDEDVARLGDGLDTLVGPRGVRLSGGQAQRASAARMFARDAQLFVIDDLSSALDEKTEREVWERLAATRADDSTTYLLVSHRPAALHNADRIVVLAAGRVEASGSLADVRATSPVVQRILGGRESG